MNERKDRRLAGAFTAITTPFTKDGGAIDDARLAEQIAFQAEGGVAGIVIAGTTGESPTLSESEYRELATSAIKRAHEHGILAILGTGSNSTAHAVELQRFAKEAGADCTLSVNPYYNKPTQEGLYRHFMAIADAADIGVMLYNIPGRSGVLLEPATVERLHAHPNIVANKEATGSTTSASEIVVRCPGLALLSGDDPMTLPFASVGGVGVVSVLSNLVPSKVSALCAAFLNGRWDEARGIHEELLGLAPALFAETNPIPVKAAMAMVGRDTGAVRLPMTEPTERTMGLLRDALSRASLL